MKGKGKFVVTSEIKGKFARFYINGILHIAVHQTKFIGLQSWKEGNCWYCIELSLEDREISLAYDSAEKWKIMLIALEKELM